MNLDAVNASFELVGAGLAWLNVRRLLRDRVVSGVYWPVTAFWSAWGVWNLFFYAGLGQPLSLAAGIVLTAANAAWVVLVLRFRRQARYAMPELRLVK